MPDFSVTYLHKNIYRDRNVQEKERVYEETMGHKFPGSGNREDENFKNRKKKTKDKVARSTTRKSSRICKKINYKEPSDEVKQTAQSEEIKQAKISEETKPVKLNNCEMCHVEFKTAEMLDTRMKLGHSHRRKLFNCLLCELPMYSKGKLKEHYNLEHN